MIDRSIVSKSFEDPEALKVLNLHKRIIFSKLRVAVAGVEDQGVYGDCVDLHPGQKHMHYSPWKYYFAKWGRRTGKTYGARAEIIAGLGIPDFRMWVAAPTYKLTDRVFDGVWKWVMNDAVYPKEHIVQARNSREARIIKFSWGAQVEGYSAEAPNSMLGDQIDLAVVDEAARIPEMIWHENIEPTLTDRKGKALLISTPRPNWFNEYFNRKDDEEFRKLGWSGSKFPTWENPFIDPVYVETKRRTLPSWLFDELYGAESSNYHGRVYKDFKPVNINEGGHLYRTGQLKINFDDTGYAGIDIGTSHPTAAVWGYVNNEGDILIDQCYREESPLHKRHAQAIRGLTHRPVRVYYISHDAQRYSGTESDPSKRLCPLDIYRQEGINALLAPRDRNAGIAVVSEYFLNTLNNQHPKIFINEDKCGPLIEELKDYIFKETDREVDAPDAPRDYKNDLVDALRYLLAPKPRYINPEVFNRHYESEEEPWNKRRGLSRNRSYIVGVNK